MTIKKYIVYEKTKLHNIAFDLYQEDSKLIDHITTDKNGIDGGNKLYILSNATGAINGKRSNMSITVTGKIGTQEAIAATNNKCQIAVYTQDLKYRPIELTNPFINSSYEKGQNWLNKKYDFTRTIHANTWNVANTLYTIEYSASQLEALNQSNVNNRSDSPYLGLCKRLSYSRQDTITRNLCEKIKK